MKIERLLGILTYLLRHGQATAPELAQRFEVSRRTILRDVDQICAAGIPLVTTQGSGGGISVAQGYHLSETLLTENELRAMLAGTAAMDSVTRQKNAQALREKLAVLPVQDWITIDLSGGAGAFETVRDAIFAREALEITYCYSKGEARRVIEPHRLVYKWGGWYLIAYCRLRCAFRLFRLGRIRNARRTGDCFARREIPAGMLLPDPEHPPCELTALYAQRMRYLLIEEGADCLTETEDGRLCATMRFASEDMRLKWALSFGDQIEVLEPQQVRREIERQAENILRRGQEAR